MCGWARFGTNDLTQTTWGFSRDDVESSFFTNYLQRGVFGVSPFESLDVDGVGRLVRLAAEEGRARRPDLKLGVCGEHGGDPDSVHFFHQVGWTTSRAHRSGCRWRGWRPGGRRWRTGISKVRCASGRGRRDRPARCRSPRHRYRGDPLDRCPARLAAVPGLTALRRRPLHRRGGTPRDSAAHR